MRMQPDFEKANEIYFRLGIIYKQQTKYQESLEVSRHSTPPAHSRTMGPVPWLNRFSLAV